MLGRARSAIYVLGNKTDASGNLVPASGMRAEFEIARGLNVYPIPVGATGHVARELSGEVLAHVGDFYKEHADKVLPSITKRRKRSSPTRGRARLPVSDPERSGRRSRLLLAS